MKLGDKVIFVCPNCGGYNDAIAFDWGWSRSIICVHCKKCTKVEKILEKQSGILDDSHG